MAAKFRAALPGRRRAMLVPVRGRGDRRLRRSSASTLAERVGARIGAALARGARASRRRRGRRPGEAERRGAKRAGKVQALGNRVNGEHLLAGPA